MIKKVLAAIALIAVAFPLLAKAQDWPGVTEKEIKIGGVFPFSGPASSAGAIGKAISAYVDDINERGGINGRRVNYIAYDDAYSPPKAVEHVRRLVEYDGVSFLFGQLGTPGNSATASYLSAKKVPSLAIFSGASKFADVTKYPLTTTSNLNYDLEGRVMANYFQKSLPGAKYGLLYQNDDLGKDYLRAFKSVFGKDFESKVIAVPYEVTEPTVDSQIVLIKNFGASALFLGVTPKFAAQALRKIVELGWQPRVVVDSPSAFAATALKPVGYDKTIGVMSVAVQKEPSDPKWQNDPEISAYRKFFSKHLSGMDINDATYFMGYRAGALLEVVLKQCGNDLSRENIIRQAKNLREVVLPGVLPGMVMNTTATNNQHTNMLQLQRWDGTSWELVGHVMGSEDISGQ